MTTALYRRYRPDTFDEVIGQEHVTDPLRAALRSGHINHAYLFSGPRGCGKTTSARIFARCLNCAEGPTDSPCGTCDSCVELATGGTGSLDVVEIDAASHNGVDDARELRERAVFSPARDRFKIFILDEAHMVTPQGFNALLKLVEEPPEHVKFVFATTEPEKVIGTIRSRTHHYPFRLIPPSTLQAYMEQICAEEGVTATAGVMPMVVRAGAGSVRDSLSVLDQLIAGTDGELDYLTAAALLGFTSATLLDDAVGAIAGRDGAALFAVVDRMVSSGHDPRRFVEDLLQRLRDVIILALAGEAGASALGPLPADQLTAMMEQSHHLGAAAATRAADLAHTALTEMTGATSPRLQLELLCARLLLPAADGDSGLAVRVDALERGIGTSAGSGQPHILAAAPAGAETGNAVARGATDSGAGPAAGTAGARVSADGMAGPAAGSAGDRDADGTAAAARRAAELLGRMDAAASPATNAAASRAVPAAESESEPLVKAEPEQAAPPVMESDRAAERGQGAEPDTAVVRRRWGEVLEALGRIRRTSWALVARSATVGEIRGGVLYLIFETPGLVGAFRGGSHGEHVATALRETLGVNVRIEAVTGEALPGGGSVGPPPPGAGGGDRGGALGGRPGSGGNAGSGESRGSGGQPGTSGSGASQGRGGGPQGHGQPQGGEAASSRRGSATVRTWEDADEPPLADEPPPDLEEEPYPRVQSVRPPSPDNPAGGAAQRSLAPGHPGNASTSPAAAGLAEDDEPSPDDLDVVEAGLVGGPVIERVLGGRRVDEDSK